jgi:ABC-2 type transport system permease protein
MIAGIDIAEFALSPRRVLAIFRRHVALLLGSWPRMLELLYWPTMQMLLWGFLTKYLASETSLIAQAGGIFLSAVLLWDALFRGQIGVSLCFLEEMYARHLGHLFVSPLRPLEFVLAVFGISFLRVLIGVGGATLLAVPVFGFWLPDVLGLALIPFFAVLLAFGWAIGLIISALVIRLGLGAESLAWGFIFFLQPISGVYYPVETLPLWLRWVAWLLPSAPVFEGMRAVLAGQGFDLPLFALALGLLVLWLAAAALVYVWQFGHARREGLLLRQGE